MTHATRYCPYCKGSGYAPHLSPLTAKQADLYRFIAKYAELHGYAPSFEEIATHFAYNSLATVHEHLSNLERKGYITRDFNLARAITCLVPQSALGTVAPSPDGAPRVVESSNHDTSRDGAPE